MKNKNKNRLLILTSSNNWQCYNFWGGRNRYRNNEFIRKINKKDLKVKKPQFVTFLSKIIPNSLKVKLYEIFSTKEKKYSWMFKKLSIKRPITNCSLDESDPLKEFNNHLASGEWRLLSWIESKNIEYDIISGVELHNNPSILKNYKSIILSTHCEYWSKEMFISLKENHLNNKLSILNFSGNSIYREVSFDSSYNIKCESLSFNDSVEDETKLIGVRFSPIDYGTCSSYKALKPKHWVFKGTDIKKNQIFGERSLNRNINKKNNYYDPGRPGNLGLRGEGASGWETDKLTKNSPKDIIKIAKGNNKNGGADMIVRDKNKNRGLLFSASSITFGGSLLIDKVNSCIALNVIKKSLNES